MRNISIIDAKMNGTKRPYYYFIHFVLQLINFPSTTACTENNFKKFTYFTSKHKCFARHETKKKKLLQKKKKNKL